jgi:hypothetical protein
MLTINKQILNSLNKINNNLKHNSNSVINSFVYCFKIDNNNNLIFNKHCNKYNFSIINKK